MKGWLELDTIEGDVTVRRPLCSRALKTRLVTRRFGARRGARLRSVPRWPRLRWPAQPAGSRTG
ncbi:hypothetical protein GCM10025331_12900 [Actinoplanes utahensis]|uniref:Uncharacterized protein n=1 Tax=Actinoplanes utahensis TaxID=1869 RepID=A0A0A6UD90_ACTUT|nr:hypothetical protein MB27_31375 [Actinoplanes utahensis]GIF29028.1 hypothetical protein Aut01nite_20140 [Actinoplanes utahensis]